MVVVVVVVVVVFELLLHHTCQLKLSEIKRDEVPRTLHGLHHYNLRDLEFRDVNAMQFSR